MERDLGSHRLTAVVIVKEGVNKSNHLIQNSLLFVTEPRTRDNIIHTCLAVYLQYHEKLSINNNFMPLLLSLSNRFEELQDGCFEYNDVSFFCNQSLSNKARVMIYSNQYNYTAVSYVISTASLPPLRPQRELCR
jgi:hypothetical protein